MTAKEFKMNTYAYKPIVETGRFSSSSGRYEINYSGILTRLIQEAGRFCEAYASDLFIDWQTVEAFINDIGDGETGYFLFGFRQYGVDHTEFVISRYTNNCYRDPAKEYRSMWRLDVSAEYSELTMTLGRVF